MFSTILGIIIIAIIGIIAFSILGYVAIFIAAINEMIIAIPEKIKKKKEYKEYKERHNEMELQNKIESIPSHYARYKKMVTDEQRKWVVGLKQNSEGYFSINNLLLQYEDAKLKTLYHFVCAGADYDDWKVKEVFFDYKNIEISIVLDCYSADEDVNKDSTRECVVSYPYNYHGDDIIDDFINKQIYFIEEPVDEILKWNEEYHDTSDVVRMENTTAYLYCRIAVFLKAKDNDNKQFFVESVADSNWDKWNDCWYQDRGRIFATKTVVSVKNSTSTKKVSIVNNHNHHDLGSKGIEGAYVLKHQAQIDNKRKGSLAYEEVLLSIKNNMNNPAKLYEAYTELKFLNRNNRIDAYERLEEEIRKKAADLGVREAQVEYGTAVNRIDYLKTAAAKGSAIALYELGCAYYYNTDIVEYRDYEKGYKYLYDAAKLGCRRAYYVLYDCYMYGRGVRKNPQTAGDYLQAFLTEENFNVEDSSLELATHDIRDSDYTEADRLLDELYINNLWRRDRYKNPMQEGAQQTSPYEVNKNEEYVNECFNKYCKLSLIDGFAEEAVVNARHVLEAVVQYLIAKYSPTNSVDTLFECIQILEKMDIIDKHYISVMHQIRLIGNKGAHSSGENISENELYNVKLWLEELIELYTNE